MSSFEKLVDMFIESDELICYNPENWQIRINVANNRLKHLDSRIGAITTKYNKIVLNDFGEYSDVVLNDVGL